MRIALYQGPEQPGGVTRNLELLGTMAGVAADHGARLMICPEMFLTGYNIGAEVHRLAEPVDGPAARQVARYAREAGIAVLYGYPERADGVIYNAAQLIDPDGCRLANSRKTHLYGELDKRDSAPATAASSGPSSTRRGSGY